jgi:hypothetical protein
MGGSLMPSLVYLLPVAMILGVVGGVLGLVVGFMNYGLAILSPPWDVTPKTLQALAILCPIGSVAGGLLTRDRSTIGTMLKPEAGGMLMCLCGVLMVGVLGISLLSALAGTISGVGGLLALVASDDLKSSAAK